MVEFAIGSTVLIMFILGIIECGFLCYQKQVITNANREGARYGVTYQTTSAGTRLAPKNDNPSIQAVVANYVNGRISTDSYNTTPIDNIASQTGNKGEHLIIQVIWQNKMDLLGGFIPSLANIMFSAQTIIKCE